MKSKHKRQEQFKDIFAKFVCHTLFTTLNFWKKYLETLKSYLRQKFIYIFFCLTNSGFNTYFCSVNCKKMFPIIALHFFLKFIIFISGPSRTLQLFLFYCVCVCVRVFITYKEG